MNDYIKGFENLTSEQQAHVLKVNAHHITCSGTDDKEGRKLKEVWVNEREITCVRCKNEEWYHYSPNGTWG